MVRSGECTQISPSVGLFFNLQAEWFPWVLAVQQSSPVSTITPPEPVKIRKIKYQPNLITKIIKLFRNLNEHLVTFFMYAILTRSLVIRIVEHDKLITVISLVHI